MRTYKMPTAVHEAPDMESAFEILDQCADIIGDYRKAGCPKFPESEQFVERMMAAGVLAEEAVEILTTTYPMQEEV